MTRPLRLIGFDSETTGLDQAKGDRFVELAVVEMIYVPSTHQAGIRKTWVQRINPERPIHPDAEAVHGISWQDVKDEPTWREVAPTVIEVIGKPDYMVIHNVGFDAPFLAGELIRVGLPVPNVQTFCTMENARWATPMGKLPKLQELCFSLGVNYDKTEAHAAEYDVRVMLQCLVRGLKGGFFKLESR